VQLRARKDALTAKRAADAAEFEQARAVRQEFLLGGDLDDADQAEGLQHRVDNAARAVEGLDAALRTLDEQINTADKALNEGLGTRRGYVLEPHAGLVEVQKKLLFLPTHLTDGIELSDDRLPVIRAGAYALSFARRGR
jgi:hypothetical protein